MSVVKNPVVKTILFVSGFVSLALGIVGAFLPLLPTTPFLILSAWCFVKSSPKAHAWLYAQPAIGKALRDWDRNGSIARSTKITAIIMIAVSLVVMWIKGPLVWLNVLISAVLAGVSVFILTRPE